MNWLDFTIIIGAIVSTAAGFFWGLIRQVVSIFGLGLSIWLATNYYGVGANIVSPFFQDQTARNAAGFLLIALGVSLVIGIAASAAQLAANLLFFGLVDHILGAVLGLLQFILVVEVVLVAGTFFPTPFLHDAVVGSKIAPIIIDTFSFILKLAPGAWLEQLNSRPR